ncbi:protein kinase domain-containing protein [Nostoc sp.]|uniref:protein kinase domain-containing protein n=1 Tax=Nostoc sp. TaxID=1180 RepID=UPI002FF89464
MTRAVEPIDKLLNYRISEQLYAGYKTLVYRAIRETDLTPVVIKLLQQEYPSFNELLLFRNQYTIAKNIDLPGIVRPYSLEPYRNSYALVMEDFGGISLRDWMNGKMGGKQYSLTEFLEIAIALSDILDGLYRHRIIHKDIKPANILINPKTQQVKLIDFSIAFFLPKETLEVHSPNVLEGTLAYLSPEQTGRMNRGIDYRSDYYSLGVTFYELLAGHLPFQSNEPMELVHCHIAKLPEELGGRGEEEIPQVLCDIVMRWMAKNAEDRYQSALGLKFDLEKCLSQLQDIKEIKSFQLGERDICDRFIIPEKLYGRQAEVESLLDAFERVSQGSTEIMLVAGFSGIGKTAVVNEVHKPIVRQRGYFIKGKFDQFGRDIPFSAFVQALNNSQDKFEKAKIYGIQMYLKMTQGENIEAGIKGGLKGLSIMGMHLPVTSEEQQTAIATEFKELKVKLQTIRTADLFDLPEMTDPDKKVCMGLLADLWGIAYMGGDQNLSCLAPLLMIGLSLTYGNAESSGFAYCLYGMNLANQGSYKTAYEFGKLAIKLDRHFNSSQFIFKTNNIFAHTINPYSQHLKTNLQFSEKSFQVCQETGNLVFGVWAVSFLIWAMLIKGDRLSDVYAETEKYLSYVQQVNDANMLYAFTLQRQFLLNLQAKSQNTDLLDDRNDEDIPYIEVWRQKNNFDHGINWYCFLKIQLSYLYGRYEDAIQSAQEAEKTLGSNSAFFQIIQYHFYYPLSLLAIYPNATLEKKKQYWDTIQEHQQIQKNWADNCPQNFLHRYLLLSAEMAKVSSNYMDAIELYDRAITKAKENEYLNEQALANELAAKFYLEWGKERIAQEYLINAYYGYTCWGAKTKVDDLEHRYPQLLTPILQQRHFRSDSERGSLLTPNETLANIDTIATLHPSINKSVTSSSNTSVMLDLATVLKASQTLSSEIELDKLLTKLLQVVIENAGADKCALLLLKEGRLVVEATAQVGQQSTVLQSIFVEDSADVPHSIIYAVKRTLQPTVILDTTFHPILIADSYIIRQQPKSLLCTPILHQGKLLGILYLENNLITGAFSSDRVKILNLLCTQAAISLENARLYQQAQDTLENLGQTEQFLRLIIDNIPQSVFWKDRNSVYLGCNHNFTQTWGLGVPEDVIGKTDYDLPWASKQSDFFVARDRRIMESGRPEFNIIETLQQADGKPIWSNTNKIPLKDREGKFFGILDTSEDITERQEAQQLLQQQKQQLEQALQELQTMQLQLVQGEKMSALGNLVAGVAHEVNNPIGFIAGNLEPAKDYVKDLFGLVNLYQEKFPNPGSDIQNEIDAIDLNYLREDLPKLLNSMKLGVSRIRSISTSLRTFSRADKDYKVPFDIHEGIDSTILILRHRLKANENRPAIDVVKNYGKLPLVECFAGQLNQVFMNLLANAIDALEQYNTERSLEAILANPNCITIQTRVANSGQHIWIKIADNGVGMSPQVKERVFDHLFTTKPVGKGTGLGLAIARQIVVEGHGGSLSCTLEVGLGTEFVIQISTQQQ